MNLRRFVTYIYQYDQGKRGKNAGFIKVDIRDSGCRMELQVRGLEGFKGRAKIFLIVPGENLPAIYAGEFPIGPGGGRSKLFFQRNLLGDSGYTVDQIQAVVICCGENRILVSCWAEEVPEAVLLGQFQTATEQPPVEVPPQTAPPQPEEIPIARVPVTDMPGTRRGAQDNPLTAPPAFLEAPSAETPAETPLTEAPADIPQTEAPADIPQTEAPADIPQTEAPADIPQTEASPDIPPAETPAGLLQTEEAKKSVETPPAQTDFQRIEITDIRNLPKRNWHLCSNSFLIHGFFNYHYLILKTEEKNGEKNCWLGVPGIYEQPERMMALLFGFPEFEPARMENDVPGNFGYWMCPLEL
ncbi:MAG: DUF6128 domain-containing protein [Muribaculaceae bacterium]|nr:DUF6128 domain-containing protein [Roseburia sp.]MCM1429882.1 DUF6128 domain-containing protein [Muribaculaceae bacterium]MCM1493850.1 DUF6128 domain-containing protein [Muribaculaceae bacterium]